MRKTNLLFLFLFSMPFVWAQKEYNVWYFGRQAGLDFNSGSPVALLNSRMNTGESSSSICDSAGNLLFYTAGDTIFNRHHQPVLNWQSARSYRSINSSTQGSIMIRHPAKTYLYYVIRGVSREMLSGNLNERDSLMRYALIDIRGDGGNGAVVKNDQILFPGRTESFAITQHSNRSDFWIMALDEHSEQINYLRTVNGEPGIVRKFSMPELHNSFYNMKFSPDGKILYCKQLSERINNQFVLMMNLYRFDNTGGVLSDQIKLPLPANMSGGRFVEFSPNSKFFYVEYMDNDFYDLLQYDVSVWDSASIMNSKTIIFRYRRNLNGSPYINGLQLGPGAKIYCFHYKNGNIPNSQISVINNPDEKGMACNFLYRSISLGARENNYGGPYYPNFVFAKRTIELGRDTGICIGDSITLRIHAEPNDSVVWNTGETGDSISVKKQGWYLARLFTAKGDVLIDSVYVSLGPKYKVFIGKDTAFCGEFSHILKANQGFKEYNWNTGEQTRIITVDQQGRYHIKVLDSNSCPDADTIQLDKIIPPQIQISQSLNCDSAILTINKIPGIFYRWNTGDTVSIVSTNQKGKYKVTASNQFCESTDSVLVSDFGKPLVDLGPDREFCYGHFMLSTTEKGRYNWNTGEASASVRIYQPGLYSLTVTKNNCSVTDTVLVSPCEGMNWYIPNAFSPNKNGINEVFKVYGSGIMEVNIEVFNRWGEKLAELSGTDPAWDGTYKGEVCMEGVYFYKVVLRGKRAGSVVNLKGTVTLLR